VNVKKNAISFTVHCSRIHIVFQILVRRKSCFIQKAVNDETFCNKHVRFFVFNMVPQLLNTLQLSNLIHYGFRKLSLASASKICVRLTSLLTGSSDVDRTSLYIWNSIWLQTVWACEEDWLLSFSWCCITTMVKHTQTSLWTVTVRNRGDIGYQTFPVAAVKWRLTVLCEWWSAITMNTCTSVGQ